MSTTSAVSVRQFLCKCFVVSIVTATYFGTNVVFAQGSGAIDIVGKQHALVIGNATYQNKPLRNPVNDATDMAQALRSVGFKVTLGRNLDTRSMRLLIQKFIDSLPTGAAALVFYAGHGVQHAGQNYLLPVDSISRITTPNDLEREAIAVTDFLQEIERANTAITVFLLDACRDSPFSAIPEIKSGLSRTVPRQQRSDPSRAMQGREKGLEGVLISYSTAPNSVALDGTGRNSPYTKHLKQQIVKSNTALETILKDTRSAVTRDTSGQQTPWYESSINGEFFPAGSDRISIEALLSMFLPEKDAQFIPSATYFMPWDPTLRSPIEWRHPGLASGSNSGDVRLNDLAGKSWSRPFSRTGNVVITVDGHPTHYFLEKTRQAVKWQLTLIGARGGVDVIGISSNVMSHGFGGFGDRKFLAENRSCRKGDNSNGHTVYDVNLTGRIPGWLSENWSCGTGGCSHEYRLFTDRREKERYGCR